MHPNLCLWENTSWCQIKTKMHPNVIGSAEDITNSSIICLTENDWECSFELH